MKNVIKYSIIVPVYNVEHYLSRCVDSILTQNYQNFELILIDDGSTDNSPKICDHYATIDSKVCVIHSENFGVSIARNLGLKKASGDYIIFVDSDDLIRKDMLEILSDKLLSHNTDIVLWGFSLFDGKKTYSDCIPDSEEIKISDLEIFPEWFNAPWSKAYKRTFLLENDITFPEKISLAEDMYFSYMCFSKIESLVFIQQCLYMYFSTRKDSACNTITVNKINDEIKSIKLLETRLDSKESVFEKSLIERKISAKMKLLFNVKIPKIKLFRETFLEVNAEIIRRNQSLFFYCIFHKMDIFAYCIFFCNKIFIKCKNIFKQHIRGK